MKKIIFISEYLIDGLIIGIISIIAFCFVRKYIGFILFFFPSFFLLGNWICITEKEIIRYKLFMKKKHYLEDVKSIVLLEKQYKIIKINFNSTYEYENHDYFILDFFLQKKKLLYFYEELLKQNYDCHFFIGDLELDKEDFLSEFFEINKKIIDPRNEKKVRK